MDRSATREWDAENPQSPGFQAQKRVLKRVSRKLTLGLHPIAAAGSPRYQGPVAHNPPSAALDRTACHPSISSPLRSFGSNRLEPSDTRSKPGQWLRSRNQMPPSQSSPHSSISMLEVDVGTVPPLMPANASDTRRRTSQLWRLSRTASSSRSLHCRPDRLDFVGVGSRTNLERIAGSGLRT
jgi:hypothetical protein